MNTTYVIEPHADDAYCSLGWHLEHLWTNKPRVIVTVYAEDKRRKEAQNYANALGIESVCLNLPEVAKMTDSSKARPIPELYKFYKERVKTEDDVILPIGLQHPDHLSVARTIPNDGEVLRYVDAPYLRKTKLADEVVNKTYDRIIISICFPPLRKWKHDNIFRSQSMFFHYEGELMRRLPEIVLL